MSIDQRTILEIILGLYKIENQYIDKLSSGINRKASQYKRHIQFEDFYDFSNSNKSIEDCNISVQESKKSECTEEDYMQLDSIYDVNDGEDEFYNQSTRSNVKDVTKSKLVPCEPSSMSIPLVALRSTLRGSKIEYNEKSSYSHQKVVSLDKQRILKTDVPNKVPSLKQDLSRQKSSIFDKKQEQETANSFKYINSVSRQTNCEEELKLTHNDSIFSKINNESMLVIEHVPRDFIENRMKEICIDLNKQNIYEQYKIQQNRIPVENMQFTNLGMLKQKLVKTYLNQQQNNNIPKKYQISSLLSDYLITAYSHEFSPVRLQQSNILIRMSYVIQRFFDDFDLNKSDCESLGQMILTIQQIEKRNQEIREKTVFCCQRVMASHSDKFLICNNCGRLCNYQKKSTRKDRNEGMQRNTSYHSIRHFDDVFKQLFIQPVEPIDSLTKLQLQEFMNRDHKQKVTIEDVRQYLKQLPSGKGSKLNKSDAFIMGVLNGETLKITNIEYQFIKNTFQQFIQILYKNAETRKNTPNCVSFIKKIIDLLYKDFDHVRHQQIIKRLHQQKENTTRKMQKTWQFLIDQFDVAQLKQEFKETIRSQQSNCK